MSKSKPFVSASDVGKAAYCPHSLSLQKIHKYKSDRRQLAGSQAHDDLNDKLLGKQDSRCFIASHALGFSDPDTQALRDWRDRVLLKSTPGKVVVSLYYRISPLLVKLLPANARLTRVIAHALRRFANRVRLK